MEQVSERIVEKIQKLLEFQNGAKQIDSPEEAANAAEKVQRLLVKYNLSIQDIGERKEKSKVTEKKFDDITPKKNEGEWILSLYNVLARFNFSTFLVVKSLETYYPKRVFVKKGVLIGEEENILTVKFLGEQLEHRLRALARKRFSEVQSFVPEKKNTFIRGYLTGAVKGIGMQLKETQEKMAQENVKVNTLVHVKDDAIKEFMKEKYPNLKSGKSSSLSGRYGYSKGVEDGKNMNINHGLNGSNPKASLR